MPEQLRQPLFPRRLVAEYVGFTFVLWLVSLVVMAGISLAIAYFRASPPRSWDYLATSVTPLFAAFMCGYVAHTYIPAYIAHGKTRREFAEQAGVFAGIFTVALTAMIVAGYLLEHVLFGIVGWQRRFASEHIFTSSTQVHLMFLEFGATLLVWSLVGVLIGASFYRSDDAGWISVLVAVVPISLIGMAFGHDWGPLTLASWFFGELPVVAPWLATLFGSAAFAVAAALSWAVIRDIPVRTKST